MLNANKSAYNPNIDRGCRHLDSIGLMSGYGSYGIGRAGCLQVIFWCKLTWKDLLFNWWKLKCNFEIVDVVISLRTVHTLGSPYIFTTD